MTSKTRTMAACLADAERDANWDAFRNAAALATQRSNAVVFILNWQRAKACLDQREAMQIVDDKTLDELSREEHRTRLAARTACEAVGIEWRMLGEIA